MVSPAMRRDVNEVYRQLVSLKPGQYYGFAGAQGEAVATCRDAYIELDSSEGIKHTNCWDAARYLVGEIGFDEVREQ